MSTRQELIDAAHANWNVNPPGVDPEVLREIGYDTPETLPATIERVLGEEATRSTAQLELVTPEHTPEASAPRETTYEPPKARSRKEQNARDMSQGLAHKTPPEWQPILRRVS